MEETTSLLLFLLDFIKGDEHLFDEINLLVSKERRKLSDQLININISNLPSLIDDYYIEEIQLINSKTRQTSDIFYFPIYINHKILYSLKLIQKKIFVLKLYIIMQKLQICLNILNLSIQRIKQLQ